MPPDLPLAHPGRGQEVPRTTARRLTGVMVALLLATACGAGFDAQTQQVYDPADGVTVRTGEVYVLNALFVANDDSTATLSVSLLDKFGDGDQLVGVAVSTNEGEPIDVRQEVESLELCAGQLIVLGPSAAVTISGSLFTPGDTVDLAMTFRDAEPVRTQVPVVARGESTTYDSVAESPEAAASPSPSCSSASLTPSPTATSAPSS